MIPTVSATQFHRFLKTGRTFPALCTCETSSGESAGEYVVKLRAGLDRGRTGLLCELIASLLASHFGISTPEPALIHVDEDFADAIGEIEPSKAVLVRSSVGLNFGSRQLSGVGTWPIDKPIPEGMMQAAVGIFAFDALIQNPDRRFNNANLFLRGDEIIIYDHELAFSFLMALADLDTPWRLDTQGYLSEHVFYRGLKKKHLQLEGFLDCLGSLPGEDVEAILAQVPEEWNNESVVKIRRHIEAVANHSAEFGQEIRRQLA